MQFYLAHPLLYFNSQRILMHIFPEELTVWIMFICRLPNLDNKKFYFDIFYPFLKSNLHQIFICYLKSMPSKWFLPLEFPIGVRQFCVIYRRFKALFCPELKGKVITNLKILALRLFSKSCLSSNRHLSSPVWIFFWNTKKDLVKRIQ